MHRAPVSSLIAFSLLVLSSATPTHAYLSSLTVDKCLAGKLTIVGKGAAAYAKCQAQNAAKPDAVAFDKCKAKTSTKIIDGFGKLDAKNSSCPGGTGDGSPQDAASATLGDDVSASVGTNPGKCDAGKQVCVGKYVAAILGCYSKAAKAVKTSGAVDNAAGGCTDKALQKLVDPAKGCLAKAAAQDGCSNAGTQESVLSPIAEIFTLARACALDPANPGCGAPPEPCQQTDGGFCWFIAQNAVSCDDVCAQKNRTYDAATASYAGSGGTDENCQGLMTDFGFGPVSFSGDCPLPGLGCGYFASLEAPVRCVTPATTSDASIANFYRVCACQ